MSIILTVGTHTNLFTSNTLSLYTKKSRIKSFVCNLSPQLVYEVEIWTILKAEKAKNKRFRMYEVWCWRRMLTFPWTKIVKNSKVFRSINTKKLILNTCTKIEKKTWIGHFITNSPQINATMEEKQNENLEEEGLEYYS